MPDATSSNLSRRSLLSTSAVAAAVGLISPLSQRLPASEVPARPAGEPFGYCLNTATIRVANLPLESTIDIAAKAGFNAIEPWISELDAVVKRGGDLKDIGKKLKDSGLAVPSAIGFAKWIVNDEAERAKGLEQMKRDMEKVLAVGGTHIAAPPVGATKKEDPDIEPMAAIERYRALCELSEKSGIVAELEVWGFSKTVTRLADAAMIAVGAGHAKACILADVYHLYKGGSDVNGLRMLSGVSMNCLHFNDYPADPPREKIADAERIFPGDGIAPIQLILSTLRDIGFRGYLSLELFNRTYWKENPQKVANAGFEKMKAAVAKMRP